MVGIAQSHVARQTQTAAQGQVGAERHASVVLEIVVVQPSANAVINDAVQRQSADVFKDVQPVLRTCIQGVRAQLDGARLGVIENLKKDAITSIDQT